MFPTRQKGEQESQLFMTFMPDSWLFTEIKRFFSKIKVIIIRNITNENILLKENFLSLRSHQRKALSHVYLTQAGFGDSRDQYVLDLSLLGSLHLRSWR